MDLFDATLDGYTLEIEALDDRFDKALVRHEIPFQDGAILEDMGQRARAVSIRCHFWDDGADHFTYADHIDLVNHLKSRDLFELVHPMYGPLKGSVESLAVRHDDRIMAAEVDITFIEDRSSALADVQYEVVDVAGDAESVYLSVQERAQDAFVQSARDLLGAEAVAICSATLTEGQSALSQLQGISRAARAFVTRVDAFVSLVQEELNQIAQPANGLTAAITFGATLPARVIGSVARCLERYVVMLEAAAEAPARFMDSFRTAAEDLEARLGFSAEFRAMSASQAGHSLSVRLRNDQQRRSRVRRAEAAAPFDLLGRWSAVEAVDPIMTVNDLESCLAVLNAMVQRAVDADRGQEDLKLMASRQQDYVSTIKLEREKLALVTIPDPTPLHLVCLAHGLPYAQAARLQSINRIPAPNATRGEVLIYVR